MENLGLDMKLMFHFKDTIFNRRKRIFFLYNQHLKKKKNILKKKKEKSFLYFLGGKIPFGVFDYPKKFPRSWDIKNRWTWLDKMKRIDYGDLEISSGKLKIIYRGQGKSDEDAAAIRSNFYLPPFFPFFYYEVKIINIGKNGFIGIGLCSSKVDLDRLPGWEKGSIGYHGDDGQAFCDSGTGVPYGPIFHKGDIIGLCLNLINQHIFFVKNGNPLSTVFKNVFQNKDSKIFAVVGLRTFGECIGANFGEGNFEFDFNTFLKFSVDKIFLKILSIKKPLFQKFSIKTFNYKKNKTNTHLICLSKSIFFYEQEICFEYGFFKNIYFKSPLFYILTQWCNEKKVYSFNYYRKNMNFSHSINRMSKKFIILNIIKNISEKILSKEFWLIEYFKKKKNASVILSKFMFFKVLTKPFLAKRLFQNEKKFFYFFFEIFLKYPGKIFDLFKKNFLDESDEQTFLIFSKRNRFLIHIKNFQKLIKYYFIKKSKNNNFLKELKPFFKKFCFFEFIFKYFKGKNHIINLIIDIPDKRLSVKFFE